MMNEESLKDWEQDHIELLTSKEMGEWLFRRDNCRDMNARPQGKWIVDDKACDLVTCPICKEQHCCKMNFCGNCGADMRGNKE